MVEEKEREGRKPLVLAERKAEADGCFQSGRDCPLGIGMQTGYGTVAGMSGDLFVS